MGNENRILENEERQADRCQCLSCQEEKEELRRQLKAKDNMLTALGHERDGLKEQLGIARVNWGPLC